MTPGIGSSGANSAARQAALVSRPQVQTRRVSVKLGPLGISYSTDQVVWGRTGAAQAKAPSNPEASANPLAAASPFAGTGGIEAPPVDSVARVGSWATGADAAQGSGPIRFGGDFDSALAQAWSALDAGRAASSVCDGTGALRASPQAEEAESPTAAERAGQEAPAAQVEAALSGAEVAGPDGPTPGGGARSPEHAGQGVAAWRLRQALAAYVACAEGFAATRPMLQVTA
ncbi:hypothetical protein SAMN04488503_1750 [Humidesulfovibrio mexicanus]|uniref:Uncharacterized protein n=1 Tax=Humidesulfovibrio mexicanus TaxID=147047 RepID=A0A239A0M7_9BACT|nr:hypothetical protein [Humidesulfovibrio mexicanus]SNR89187.1 hypothetical protein SAMN04488503_1750 [Humidesulfovibrio mexicanus]